MVTARAASVLVLVLVLVLACSGCAGRFVYDDVDGGDASIDTGTDAAVDVVYEAQVRTATPPPHGTYSPNGGFCPFVACGPNAICDEVSGWCCGGRWVLGECKCGDSDGCAPPSVCCPAAGGPAGAGACVASVAACPGAR